MEAVLGVPPPGERRWAWLSPTGPPGAPSSPTPSSSGASLGIYVGIGLVAGVVLVLGAIAGVVTFLRFHKRRQQARRAAERQRRLNPELVEGDPGPLRVPIIVVLPDNKLRFGWELRCNGEDAPDLERCGSDSIKDSALDEAESRDGDDQLSAASGSGGSGSSVPRTRIRPPLVRASVHMHPSEDKC